MKFNQLLEADKRWIDAYVAIHVMGELVDDVFTIDAKSKRKVRTNVPLYTQYMDEIYLTVKETYWMKFCTTNYDEVSKIWSVYTDCLHGRCTLDHLDLPYLWSLAAICTTGIVEDLPNKENKNEENIVG